MKKTILLSILLLLCVLLSACGDLTYLSRSLLLDESISPTMTLIDADSSDLPSTSSSPTVQTAYSPLYETYSYIFPTFTEKERTIFLALYEGIMAFQENIPLPVSATSDEIKDMMAFLCSECPELLQLDSAWTQRSNLLGYVTAVTPAYTINQETYLTQKHEIEILLSQLHTELAGANPYEIELTLFDYIINNCWYSLDAPNCQSAYGALIGGAAKCDGRAKALVWGLRSFGIKSSVITGSNHAWVIAQINGYNYNIDPTYDDNEADGIQQPCAYTHFNIPESSIAADPYPADELFIRRGYPSTIRWDCNYHVKSGLWVAAGQNAENIFLNQLETITANNGGCINLRFESTADFEAAKTASQNWIQNFINGRGLSCNITSYDYSQQNTLFLQITF